MSILLLEVGGFNLQSATMDDEIDISIPFLESGAVDYFMPQEAEFDSVNEELRARLLVLSQFVLLAWAPPNMAFYFFIDAPAIGGVVVALAVASLAPLYFSRATGRYDFIGHYLCTASTATMAWISWSTGGLDSLAIYWLIIAPVYAHVFIGRRASFLRAGIALAVMGGLAGAHFEGLVGEEFFVVPVVAALDREPRVLGVP